MSPSDLATPTVLRHILLHCDDSTLTRCMRVSQSFYDIAGPLLYREISIPGIDLSKLFLGHNIEIKSRAPRGSSEPINLKQNLLDHIGIIEISYHNEPHDRTPIQHLPRLRTVRIITNWWCTCPEQRHFELCHADCEPEDRSFEPCPFRTRVSAHKIVLTSVRHRTIKPLLKKLEAIIHAAEILTVIITPDIFGCTIGVADTIRATFEAATKPKTLRIIFTPLSCRIARHAKHKSLSYEARSAVKEEVILTFCRRITSDRYQSTVFFAEGFSPDWHQPHRPPVALSAPAGLRELERRGPDCDQPHVSFKTRLDYVNEGTTDEIDPEQLDAWREEEARLAQNVVGPKVAGVEDLDSADE